MFKRDYDMKFDLLDYNTTVGHLSLYYDAGGMFDIEINVGRYLAGDLAQLLQSRENLGVDGRLVGMPHSLTFHLIFLEKVHSTKQFTRACQ